MKDSITLSEAQMLLDRYITSPHLRLHSLESEAVLRGLAKYFGEDEELRGVTGLLHDLDLDEVGENIVQHSKKTIEILQSEGFDIPVMFNAILAHAEGFVPENTAKRESRLDFALAAGENVTGLIYAYVLMRPDKKIAGVEISSLKKRLKDKHFAAKVNRGFIIDIEKTGLSLDQFLQIALDAMKNIADQIGI